MITFRTFAATKIRLSSIIENEKVENINFLSLVIILYFVENRKIKVIFKKNVCLHYVKTMNYTFGDPITLEL